MPSTNVGAPANAYPSAGVLLSTALQNVALFTVIVSQSTRLGLPDAKEAAFTIALSVMKSSPSYFADFSVGSEPSRV